jgi:hypothetical protein
MRRTGAQHRSVGRHFASNGGFPIDALTDTVARATAEGGIPRRAIPLGRQPSAARIALVPRDEAFVWQIAPGRVSRMFDQAIHKILLL